MTSFMVEAPILFNFGLESSRVSIYNGINSRFSFFIFLSIAASITITFRSADFSLSEAVAVQFKTFRFLAVAAERGALLGFLSIDEFPPDALLFDGFLLQLRNHFFMH